jgi:hypothetical protein
MANTNDEFLMTNDELIPNSEGRTGFEAGCIGSAVRHTSFLRHSSLVIRHFYP